VVLEHFLSRAVTARDIDCYYGSLEAVIAAVRPFPGIHGMLSALRREGYRLGTFTHATRRAATMTLTSAGLGHFQLTLVGGEEIAKPKPAPEGLRLACRHLNVGSGPNLVMRSAPPRLADGPRLTCLYR